MGGYYQVINNEKRCKMFGIRKFRIPRSEWYIFFHVCVLVQLNLKLDWLWVHLHLAVAVALQTATASPTASPANWTGETRRHGVFGGLGFGGLGDWGLGIGDCGLGNWGLRTGDLGLRGELSSLDCLPMYVCLSGGRLLFVCWSVAWLFGLFVCFPYARRFVSVWRQSGREQKSHTTDPMAAP